MVMVLVASAAVAASAGQHASVAARVGSVVEEAGIVSAALRQECDGGGVMVGDDDVSFGGCGGVSGTRCISSCKGGQQSGRGRQRECSAAAGACDGCGVTVVMVVTAGERRHYDGGRVVAEGGAVTTVVTADVGAAKGADGGVMSVSSYCAGEMFVVTSACCRTSGAGEVGVVTS